MGGAVDAIEDAFSSGYDAIEDAVSDVYEEVVAPVWRPINEAIISPWYDPIEAAVAAEADRIEAQIAAEAKRLEERAAAEFDRWEADVARSFDEIERWGQDFNKFIDDAARWTSDLGKGLEFLVKAAMNGDMKALLYIAVLVVSIVIAVVFPPASGLAAWAAGLVVGLSTTLAVVVWVTVYAATVLSWLYGVYNVMMMLDGIADLGDMLKRGGKKAILGLSLELEKMVARGRVATVSSAFNGQMSMWMAGGDLYDSMKAGDIAFKPDGNLNSQVFLGLPNMNSGTKFSRYQSGSIGDFASTKTNALAGDMFFSGTALVA